MHQGLVRKGDRLLPDIPVDADLRSFEPDLAVTRALMEAACSVLQPRRCVSLLVQRGFVDESVVDQLSGLVSSEPRLLDVEGDDQCLPAVEFHERE